MVTPHDRVVKARHQVNVVKINILTQLINHSTFGQLIFPPQVFFNVMFKYAIEALSN